MAADYTSGSASSFSDLLTALEAFLTTVGGWAAQAGPAASGSWLAQRILTKGDLVYRFVVNTAEPSFYCIGATGVGGGTTTGDSPYSVKLSSPNLAPIVFPITYEIFWNDTPEEVYVVISYGGNKYQHLNFGESAEPSIGGTGAWLTASIRGDYSIHTDTNYSKVFLASSINAGDQYIFSTPYSGLALGYFIEGSGYSYMTSMLHCGLEGTGWKYPSGSTTVSALNQPFNTDLLMSLPSTFNEANVLVPIHTAVVRTDGLQTIAVSLRHARYVRIDNITPGEVITYGGDQWKVFPLYAKNVVERNGVGWATGTNHSGTLGVALRYPGV